MFHSLPGDHRPLIRFTLDGEEQVAAAGISVAAAVLSIRQTSRRSVISGEKRGPYCMMGICFDCLMRIDGEPNRQTCQVILEPGMQISTQSGSATLKFELAEDE